MTRAQQKELKAIDGRLLSYAFYFSIALEKRKALDPEGTRRFVTAFAHSFLPPQTKDNKE